ncbi:alpha/beta fold hydrolase [Kribbella sp. NPDC056345]|uniref:alpha/beta fold hydrolase n=1 Tax=Kribbella sp. NPDC056345 TaxID=3345789 RepID=UPI0035D852C5
MPRLPGLVVTDHLFTVPLDHSRPDGETIEVLGREVVAAGKADAKLPWLVYLQGGPGLAAPRPLSADGWIGRATKDYRVLLLDQRGVGRSTAITARTAAAKTPAELAAYLRLFRADSIVRDAELIREQLSPGEPWTSLGTSYGGFITLTYLSLAPEGLKTCLVTGGLPGLDATPDDVYSRTWPRVVAKNDAYYARYPDDVERVRRIADHLRDHDVRLPNGDRLDVRRFQLLGVGLGMGSAAETLHWLIDDAWDGDVLSYAFLSAVMSKTAFGIGPLWVVIHELIYAQGDRPTNWAAERLRPPEFDPDAARLLFTGEMIFPWMLEQISGLREFAEAANLLATEGGWPRLYDVDRLAANRVPLAAAIWHEDMYVDADLSLQTAARVGNVTTWITNEWQHDGGSASGGSVLDRLLQLAADLPPVGG